MFSRLQRNIIGYLALAALVLPAAGGAPPVESRSGMVVSVDGDRIIVSGGGGGFTLKLTDSVRIWKGEDGALPGAIQLGDDLAMRGEIDADGTFVPSEIWVNITALDGVIRKIDGPVVKVDVVRNDSVRQTKLVRVSKKTMSDTDAPFERKQLKVGRVMRVIGLALNDGSVQASRITVYLDGKPLRR